MDQTPRLILDSRAKQHSTAQVKQCDNESAPWPSFHRDKPCGFQCSYRSACAGFFHAKIGSMAQTEVYFSAVLETGLLP
jgi:hypothetical protein